MTRKETVTTIEPRRVRAALEILDARRKHDYPTTLEKLGITPTRFAGAVDKAQRYWLSAKSDRDLALTEPLAVFISSPFRVEQLYEMPPEYVLAALQARVRDGKRLPQGINNNTKNVAWLIEGGFNHTFPGYTGMTREQRVRLLNAEFVQGDQSVRQMLKSAGIDSVTSLSRAKGWCLADLLLETDKVVAESRGEPSVFDLQQPEHVHYWEITNAPLQGPDALDVAYVMIAHALEDGIPGYREADRDQRVALIEKHVLGYKGGMGAFFKDQACTRLLESEVLIFISSPRAALEFYDDVARYEMGGVDGPVPSMFDELQSVHLTIPGYSHRVDTSRLTDLGFSRVTYKAAVAYAQRKGAQKEPIEQRGAAK